MKYLITFLTFTIIAQFNFAQNVNDDVVAKVGDKIITLEEFKFRYEFTPQINRKQNDNGKAKEELLYTLIAEKLFAIEAAEQRLDTLKVLKSSYVPLEKMYVRDALYENQVSSKVEFDVDVFNEGLKLANQKLFVDFVFTKDKKAIFEAHKLLSSSPKFDSLVTLIVNAEYVSEPYEVLYGKMHEVAEDAIFALNINEISLPVESPEGWYIFRLLSKIPVTFTSGDQRSSKVKQVVEGRIEDSIYNDFWKGFFIGKKVTTDGALFWYFAEEMQKLIVDIKDKENIAEGEKINITADKFANFIRSIHADSLVKDFIKLDEAPVSFEQFLRDFSFEGFFTFYTDIDRIAGQLNSRVKRQIELELLSRQGYSKGMESLPDVKSSTDIWKENYLSTVLKKEIVVSTKLTDAEINKIVSEGTEIPTETKVNLVELLTDSLDVIKKALSLSDNESQFKEFAKVHTKRVEVQIKGGETGLFSISENKEIGEIAETMEVGDVYGPLEIDGAYSVFKLIEKTETPLIVKENISTEDKMQLRYNKVVNKLENMTVDLAEKHNVTINNELLNSLNLLNTQMIVFRYMGFGGRLPAYPYSTPFYKWKEKWEQKKKDVL